MRLLMTGGGGVVFFGRPSGRPSVNNYLARRDISVFTTDISIKSTTNRLCIMWEGIAEKVSRSEVKGQGHSEAKCTCAAEEYISTVWHRGALVMT